MVKMLAVLVAFVALSARGASAQTIRRSGGKIRATFSLSASSPAYPAFAACNASALYEAECKPKAATCEETHPVKTKHGIGNSLQTSYKKAVLAAFGNGCAPEFEETMGGFKLQEWVEVPARVPTELHKHTCTTWAITQPRANLRALVDTARGDGKVPILAIHVRTGWVDAIARQADVWDNLKCDGEPAELRRRLSSVDAGMMVNSRAGGAGEETPLNELAARVIRDADRAWGVGGWDAYVASDAPGVRRWLGEKLRAEGVRAVRHLNGTIGHNYWATGAPRGRGFGGEDAQALADLILLSEADVIVHYRSDFPQSAADRSFCPGLRLVVGGHPRHALQAISRVSSGADIASIPEAWNCAARGATTLRQCQCMYKGAYA